MKHPANRRNPRFIAVVMLLLWMFVLGSGVANACLSGDAHRDAASHEYRSATPSVSVITGQVAHGKHAVPVVAVAQDACADCAQSDATDCDVVTLVAAAPPAGKLVGKLAEPEFEPTVSTDWQAFAAAPLERSFAAHRHRGAACEQLPAYLRFLRLTL